MTYKETMAVAKISLYKIISCFLFGSGSDSSYIIYSCIDSTS